MPRLLHAEQQSLVVCIYIQLMYLQKASTLVHLPPSSKKHRDCLADVLEMVRKDPVLEEEMRTMLGVQGLEGKAAVHAENTRAMAASLAALKGKSQSNIGRVAYTTVLAAVAGAGEHTCSPTDPCNPAERCPPAEPQGGVSFAQRAESLGVREKTFRAAHVRMHHTDHTIPPPQALEEGRYCWTRRKTRSDATDERVLELAIRFWHSDDVSRASGDSVKKAMWRPSKMAGEEYHPRRQLMVVGDKVFRMFLAWPQYVALKKELLEEDPSFKDPGRTTFLSTRCGCLVEPKVSQCACMIHTQQNLYLDALRFFMAAIHANCDCTCSWCEGQGCQKWVGMCKSLHAFSEALACPKVDLLAGDASGGFEFWGRKPVCVAGTCAECGFGKPNGIPTDCQAFASHAERPVGWIRFMDQKMSDGTVHSKQKLPQSGKLSELWEEFMAHSLVVSYNIVASYRFDSKMVFSFNSKSI
ncbi:unnamed protein product [Ectocarpus sp. 12 AP-2014]